RPPGQGLRAAGVHAGSGLAQDGHLLSTDGIQGGRGQGVKRLWYSPTLRTTVVYGAAGAGFAGANLILARVLPPVEYGIFTLVTALANLAFLLAPIGLDGIVLRRHIVAGPRLLSRVILVTTLVGLAFAVIGALAYDLRPSLLLMLVVSTIGGGALVVARASSQSE